MNEPILLLQSGDVMRQEKIACSFSYYPILYTKYEQIEDLNKGERFRYVPVGSVEFTRRYAEHMGLVLPESYTYPEPLFKFMHRRFRKGTLHEARSEDFVKPSSRIKLFTGCRKSEVPPGINEDVEVWISDYVPFGAEYRFYIHDFASRPEIEGWARYDELVENSPKPDIGYVERMMHELHESIGPGAYCLDIGWRKDIGRYDLVEFNDAWSLGYYENTDPHSNPPSRQQYADMLVSRWRQILFCNLLDEQGEGPPKVYQP